jgi:hypothetical protein
MVKRISLAAGCLLLCQQLLGQQLSYRNYQSPVKSQESRGTCTAFAVVAAMETFDGVPCDLSEQYIYMQAKLNHWEEMKELYDEGASFRFYLDVLKLHGTVNEETSPYVPDAPIWEQDADAFEKMKADIQAKSAMEMFSIPQYSYKLHNDLITYVQGGKAKSVEWIKARLDEGVKAIPVGYGVNGRYWSAHQGLASDKIKPEDFLLVITDIGKPLVPYRQARAAEPNLNLQILSGQVHAEYSDTALVAKEGHAVTIVGYDETGFLIKNSWSEDWGDSGYGWVSYDYHELFCNEALVIRGIQFTARENLEKVPAETSKWHLKVVPHKYDSEQLGMHFLGAQLSLAWHGSKAPVALSEVVYQIKDSQGNDLEEHYGYVSGIFNNGSKFGYPASALDKLFKNGGMGAFTVIVKCTTTQGATFSNRYLISGGSCQEVKPIGS